jgi:membrane protein DedA with SNARE-associated domain
VPSVDFAGLIAVYGVWVVGVVVGLESMGLPLPGETTLVTAALYSGTTGRLSVFTVVAAAAVGAIAGDNAGYWLGRRYGCPWLARHESRWWLTPRRVKLGQYLFHRHGGKVVFFGRFIAVLRALAGVLAGINRMDWRRFLLFNACGGVVWASLYGFGAGLFGRKMTVVVGPAGLVLGLAAAAALAVGLSVARRYEDRWGEEAERVLPDRLLRP